MVFSWTIEKMLAQKAGCHAANLGRPFARNVLAFSQRPETPGFGHDASIRPRQEGLFQIEVHPRAATVNLFGLARIVKHKRGTREQRTREPSRLRRLMLSRLPELDPALSPRLPAAPRTENLKPIEDRIDAVLPACVAARRLFWARQRNTVYGTEADGHIVVPEPTAPERQRTLPLRAERAPNGRRAPAVEECPTILESRSIHLPCGVSEIHAGQRCGCS